MRRLDCCFEKKFENELSPIIDFVKNHKDVFLGIRNNYVDLYVDGGCFLELKYNTKNNTVTGKIDENYFKKCPKRMPKTLKNINGEPIIDINSWMEILEDLKNVVSDYQNKIISESDKKKREKILQQKLVHEFNNNSKYFAYDIEYVVEGLSEYVLDANKNKIKTKGGKMEKNKQLGRNDIMLISMPSNNQIKVYFMEVKEGTSAFGGVLPDESKNDSAPSFGSGIVGHLKNNVSIINHARKDEPFESKYNKDKNKEKYLFNIREDLLEEIKYCLHFYTKFKLIENKNFKNMKDDEIDKLTISNEKNSIELVFFLGNYKDRGSFENYLGIGNGKHSKYSVKSLLNNNMKENINLDYITDKELFDFKVCKEKKNCEDSGFNLDIENYDTISKENFQ